MTLGAHNLLLILGSVFVLGLRHGVDYDHVAAITDLTALDRSPMRAMRLGLTYAAGHAIVLLALGMAATAFGVHVPAAFDAVRERIVGATLIVLGVIVAIGMIMHRHHGVHGVSRAAMMLAAYRRAVATMRRWRGLNAGVEPNGRTPAFLMGVLHGLGAETPTQLLLLVVAAGVGRTAGLLCVTSFVVGLFVTNTAMSALMAGLYHRRTARHALTLALSGASAAYSMVIGTIYLLGAGAGL